ncbi:MAG TPA: hypothetical protein VEC43_04370 [Candidatus Acidoferrales bacterium]|nr:hypothetical protein [Candidatus Acidoferrales bacterium]
MGLISGGTFAHLVQVMLEPFVGVESIEPDLAWKRTPTAVGRLLIP